LEKILLLVTDLRFLLVFAVHFIANFFFFLLFAFFIFFVAVVVLADRQTRRDGKLVANFKGLADRSHDFHGLAL
jgi:hypothetical protein